MKKFKKIVTSLFVVMLALAVLVGCGSKDSNAGESIDEMDTVKIGVLVYDSTDSEVVAFKNYYTEYIQESFPVEFVYSDTINTAEEEVAAIENMITTNVKGIISFSDQDRVASIKLAEEAQVYYAVGAGTLTDEQYEQVKDNPYYVGSIGPSLEKEKQVGYDMAQHYIGEGYTNFLLYTGGYPYVDMHKERTDGMIRAFEEHGVTYTPGENGMIGSFEHASFKIDVVEGFPDDAGAFWGTVGQKVGEADLEVVISAALGVEFFGASIAQVNPEIKLGTVASFTDAYTQAFNANPSQVDYLAGKYASSVGPIFAALFNAVTGHGDVLRDGGAFSLDQDYWVAVGTDAYNVMSEIANSTANPAYRKADLDKHIKLVNDEANFKDFKAFVEASTFEDVENLHK